MGEVRPCYQTPGRTITPLEEEKGGVKCPRVSSAGVPGWWEAGKGAVLVGVEKLIEIEIYK